MGANQMPGNGMMSVQSHFSAKETIERLLATLAEKHLTVFARHAAGAASIGLSLRTTELVIFGSAKGGTPLMLDQQSTGIDLPLKVLVWEDAEHKAWLSYNDPTWIAQRHSLGARSSPAVTVMADLLRRIAQEVTGI
jgi:uncharacterized protein (DUF302 family)